MPAASKKNLSKTHYYELLEVDPSASEKDLKKAYRIKALRLHPDKQGGDGEPFRVMKYAYDVLSDPKKRQAYDKYGEAGVKLVEGNLTPEVAMQMFLSIGAFERFLMILLVTVLIGYLLLFPILLSVRWDHPRSMTFAHVFLPVWIGLALVLSFCLCFVHPPAFPDLEEEDEHARKEIEETQQKQVNDAFKLRWGSTAVILTLCTLLAFLVLRLDGETNWSYFLVIWPWIVLELGMWAWKCHSAEAYFMMTGHDPEILTQGKWLTKDWNVFYAGFTCPHVFHIIFACLIAFKMDGTYPMSWWQVFGPFWVEFALNVALQLSNCNKIKSTEEVSGMPPEQQMKQITKGTIIATIFANCVWVGCVFLLCFKITHPTSFPAWIIFLPMFFVGGCFCCCLSCFLCCMSPESMRGEGSDDEETGFGASPQPGGAAPKAAPMYGSTK